MPTGAQIEVKIDDYDPNYHIGKRSGNTFTWAQSPNHVVLICRTREEEQLVEDEYGTVFTGNEFLEILSPLKWNENMIGKQFS